MSALGQSAQGPCAQLFTCLSALQAAWSFVSHYLVRLDGASSEQRRDLIFMLRAKPGIFLEKVLVQHSLSYCHSVMEGCDRSPPTGKQKRELMVPPEKEWHGWPGQNGKARGYSGKARGSGTEDPQESAVLWLSQHIP